ncbi:MAG: 4Fe-4S dicluster domain-containing protein [Phascolarctobacterium sp.]|nr:4Fe-4S dicluster domain-containing protein [Phascolarctobacterium sp.]
MLKISLAKLPELCASLNKKAELLVPAKNKAGKVDYKKFSEDVEICLDEKTSRSAKDIFFPQVENLLKFKAEGKSLSLEQALPPEHATILFGVRACDARSFKLLDKVFLANPVDSYYKARRENCLIVGLGCSEPEETCFCSTFNIDATSPEADINTWLVGEELYWSPVSEKGQALTEKVAALFEEADTKPVKEQAQLTKNILSLLPLANFKIAEKFTRDELVTFNSKVWGDLSATCLSCCTCTYVCPTCHCYDIRDYKTDDNTTERFRCWDSCMASDFTKMAHGNPRKTKLERFRQRYMHKLVYFPENNDGDYACVGCGRCLEKCPANLNIVKVAKALEVSDDV